jgi:hypothetical protein
LLASAGLEARVTETTDSGCVRESKLQRQGVGQEADHTADHTGVFDGDCAVIDEHAVLRTDFSVVTTVDVEAAASNPDIGVFAGNVAPDRGAGFIGQAPRFGNAGAIAVGNQHIMRSDPSFHAAQEQVVVVAAGGCKADPHYGKEALHEKIVNYFVL